MNQQASELLRRVRCVLFPRRCALCGRVVTPDTEICSRCMQEAHRVTLPVCLHCGCGKRDCACEKHRSRFVSAFAAPFYYEGVVCEGISRLKFHSEPDVAEVLGAEMARFARRVYAGVQFDLVTFIPMTPREKRERRYNQSELLARSAARELLLPCVPTLEKLYETRRQRTLDQRRRGGNVFGVFEAIDPQAIRDRRILLCDDLRTTGATLTECAKMLRIRGAREVLCLTAAVGFPQKEKSGKDDIQ